MKLFGSDPSALCYDVSMPDSAPGMMDALAGIGAGDPLLRLLVLFGSRERGDARPESDWDLGYLAETGFEPMRSCPIS